MTPKLYSELISGGAILVDDLLNDNTYDGAYQAYMEFCNQQDIASEIFGNKCGVIRKLWAISESSQKISFSMQILG